MVPRQVRGETEGQNPSELEVQEKSGSRISPATDTLFASLGVIDEGTIQMCTDLWLVIARGAQDEKQLYISPTCARSLA
jgi:hypothetical protein